MRRRFGVRQLWKQARKAPSPLRSAGALHRVQLIAGCVALVRRHAGQGWETIIDDVMQYRHDSMVIVILFVEAERSNQFWRSRMRLRSEKAEAIRGQTGSKFPKRVASNEVMQRIRYFSGKLFAGVEHSQLHL